MGEIINFLTKEKVPDPRNINFDKWWEIHQLHDVELYVLGKRGKILVWGACLSCRCGVTPAGVVPKNNN